VAFTKVIRETFLGALYSYLDGLVHLAFADAERNDISAAEQLAWERENHGRKPKTIDITQLDSRILITISNLSELRSVIIPKLLKDFEKIFNVLMNEDGKVLIYTLIIGLFFFYINQNES